MSYDITSQVQSRRTMQDIREQTKTEDTARDNFMSVTNRRRPSLTEFEQSFVESWAASVPSKPWWTPRRREVADELRRKYL